jgi:hypothetical protein
VPRSFHDNDGDDDEDDICFSFYGESLPTAMHKIDNLFSSPSPALLFYYFRCKQATLSEQGLRVTSAAFSVLLS